MCERRGGLEGGRRHGQRQKARMVREEKGRVVEGKLMSSESRQCAGSVWAGLAAYWLENNGLWEDRSGWLWANGWGEGKQTKAQATLPSLPSCLPPSLPLRHSGMNVSAASRRVLLRRDWYSLSVRIVPTDQAITTVPTSTAGKLCSLSRIVASCSIIPSPDPSQVFAVDHPLSPSSILVTMASSIVSFLSARPSSLPPPLSSLFSLWWADDMRLLDFHFRTAVWKLVCHGIHLACGTKAEQFWRLFYFCVCDWNIETWIWNHKCLNTAQRWLLRCVAVLPFGKRGAIFSMKWPVVSSRH